MLTVNEYLLVPVKYMLNGKSHVVKLRLTILPMSEGNQIIVGLPELAGPLSDLFADMVQKLKDVASKAALAARSIPRPLHMIRSTDLQQQYLEQMHDNLNFEPVSSRTRCRTANAPPPAGAEIVNLNTPVTASLAPVTTTHDLISPEPNVFAYQSPTSGITYTEFDLRGNPADRSRIVITENISAIDIQHEQHRIDKRKWRDQCPIGIDQRLYPEYADLPEPYKPFCHYMRKHHYTVPADWQDRDCPAG